MKKNEPQGRRGEKRLVLICAIVVLLTFSCSQWLLMDSKQTDQTKNQLFWNGYAKLYYEKTGSWSGLTALLQADRYMFAEDKSPMLTIYDKDGTTIAAELDNKESIAKHARKIAILSEGEIVGYTSYSNTLQVTISSKSLLLSLIIGLFVFLIGAGILRQSKYVANRTERSIAKAIWSRSSSALMDDSHTSGEIHIQAALNHIEELARRVERLETVRRSMVADIAHELRTPIAVMRTQLDHAIQEGELLPLSKTVSLHDETLRLTKLVRDLQELSLAESGHLSLSKSWFSLTELAATVAETLAVDTVENEILLNTVMDRDIRLYADETRIRQILINVIGNALQHTRHELRIEARLGQGQVEISVADDGLGIEEEELAYVFDRFYRGKAHHEANKRSPGLGLGLAIANQFAQAHGGTLRVTSHYGKGAIFTLCLPIIEV
ncbi:hypothetical protein BK133_04570 [Paenibacillus sp. FSL H8-0548]|uniref:sensor histidine kinase n=1 Tax=Paenibacillus sp. FSL H8-0548 TaxID=1920422 RepID=UPI00096EA7C4|nr:HAMP domain-containing sensor histidine kinase [Paenibacillus sp. FSL H8-0548]OMF37810.1 hypothetical protein BK133_04570 [Paenibacillus sp. FSL H8-0548]